MTENEINNIERDIEAMLAGGNSHLEEIIKSDNKRKPKLIIGLIRLLELKLKLLRIKLKTLEYEIDNRQMRDKHNIK